MIKKITNLFEKNKPEDIFVSSGIKLSKNSYEKEKFLREVISSINSTFDIEEIFCIVSHKLALHLNVTHICITQFLSTKDTTNWIIRKEYICNSKIRTWESQTGSKSASNFWVKHLLENKKSLFIDKIQNFDIPSTIKDIYKRYNLMSGGAAPIKNKNSVWGSLGIAEYNSCRKWTPEEIEIIEIIAEQLYFAIEHAEIYKLSQNQAEKEKRNAEREKLLRIISNAIRNSLYINEIKRTLVDEIGKTFSADRCIIHEFDSSENRYLPAAKWAEYTSGSDVSSMVGEDISTKEYELFMHFLRDKKFEIFFSDAKNYLKENNAENSDAAKILEKFSIKSAFTIPMVYKDQLLGIFTIHYTKNVIPLSEEDKEFIRILADQAGVALFHSKLYYSITQKALRDKLLRNIIINIRSSLDINETLNFICKEVAGIFNVQRVGLGDFIGEIQNDFMLSEYKTDKNIKGVKDIENIDVRVLYFWREKIIDEGIILAIDNIEESDAPEYFKETQRKLGIKSIIGIPLKTKNSKRWGVIILSEYQNYRHWTKEEKNLLELIADHISIALMQSNLYSQSQQATKLKSQFIATMSHEFRTPLNAIIGFSDMILTGNYGGLSQKQYQYIENISKSGKHLLNLVNDILDVSKIEAGKLELFFELINAKTLILETVELLRSISETKNIEIKLDLLDIELKADAKRFKQIVYNLLSNAIKFTPDGGAVYIKNSINSSNLVIMIEDTGIGISNHDKNKIFSEFKQIDSSYARTQQGTGLGLALSKKLVELHSGTIHFDSEFGKGSRFWFVIPEARLPNSAALLEIN